MTPDDLARIDAWAQRQLTSRTPPRDGRAQALRAVLDLVAELRRARRLEPVQGEARTAYEQWRASGTTLAYGEWAAERVEL